jgi:hypothetical protein
MQKYVIDLIDLINLVSFNMKNKTFTNSKVASSIAMGSCLLISTLSQAQSSISPRIVYPKEVVLAALDTPATSVVAPIAPALTDVTFSAFGKTVTPTDTVSWTFQQAPNAGDGQFAVMAGIEDVSPNCRWVSPTQLDCVFAAMPLPVGTIDIKFFTVAADNQWLELAKSSFTVAGASSAAQAQAADAKHNVFTPSLIVGAKSQAYESHTAGAVAPVRETYLDGTLQAGLQTENYGSDWSTKSQINIVGSSYKPEAVNFGAQGANASKVDVANYLIGATSQNAMGLTSASLGNVQAGNNPLLANGIGNRGALVTQKFNERFDLSLAAQNGSSIVGAPNILGLADNQHRMSTATIGVWLNLF